MAVRFIKSSGMKSTLPCPLMAIQQCMQYSSMFHGIEPACRQHFFHNLLLVTLPVLMPVQNYTAHWGTGAWTPCSTLLQSSVWPTVKLREPLTASLMPYHRSISLLRFLILYLFTEIGSEGLLACKIHCSNPQKFAKRDISNMKPNLRMINR